VIKVKNVTKYYGPFLAVENASFEVGQGEILGFLGPNGAGKTTVMRIITGFMPPSSGTVEVAGYDVLDQSLEARRHIGYMPETVPLYGDMKVVDYLDFMGSIRGMSRAYRRTRIAEVVDVCQLGDYFGTPISRLSKGFRQRVGIAQAILHEPEVLVLDEPTIGIDPIQVVETRQLIKELGKERTVVLSTHILPEVSVVCKRVVIIHEGKIIAEDLPENLSARLQAGQRVLVEVKGPAPEVMSALRSIKGLNEVTREALDGRDRYAIQSRPGVDIRDEVAKLIVSRGWSLLHLQAIAMTLEEIFLKLTTQEGEVP